MLAELPPVRGVFHLAGSIADAMITQVSAEDFGRTYSSKVLSAKNLLENLDGLDFAVFFSSVSACFGFHGQAAYAAANAALDELCRSYRKSGVPVILPHWGAWALGKGSAYAGEKAEALPGLLFRQPGEQDISAMRAFEGSAALKLLGTVLSSPLTDPILIGL